MSSDRESAPDAGRSVRSNRLRWAHPFADVFDEAPDHRNTVLHAGLGSQPEDLKQCAAANRVLESLGDPRILQARAVTRLDDGRLSLTTDAAPGMQPVGSFIGRPARLSWVVHVLLETCGALDAAHGLGVFHGALGGGNVLVGDEPERPTVKVTDFGLAHMFSADRAGAGPAQWQPLAPEHMMGHHAGPSTDVYLVGALAFALLAGRPVFRGDTVSVVVRRHAIEEPPMLHRMQLPVRVPRALSRIVLRCLVKEVEDRFDGPADLADALRGHMARSWEENAPSEASGPIGRSAAVGTSLSAAPPASRRAPTVERSSPLARAIRPEPLEPIAAAPSKPEPIAVARASTPAPVKPIAAVPSKPEPAKVEPAKTIAAAPSKPEPAKAERPRATPDAAKPKIVSTLPKPKPAARKEPAAPERVADAALTKPIPSTPANEPITPTATPPKRAPISDPSPRLLRAEPVKLPAPGAKPRTATEPAKRAAVVEARSEPPKATTASEQRSEPAKVEPKRMPARPTAPSDTAEISLASVEVIDEGDEASTADFEVDVARAARAELEATHASHPPPAEPSEPLAVASRAIPTSSTRKWIVPAAAGAAAIAIAVALLAGNDDDGVEPAKNEAVAAARSDAPAKAERREPSIAKEPAPREVEVGVAKAEPDPPSEVEPIAEPDPEIDPALAEAEPEIEPAPEVAEEASAQGAPSAAQQARAATRDASEARRKGDIDKAVRLYRRALFLRPAYAPAASGLAFIHFNRGEYDKAAQYGRMAVRSAPSGDNLLRLGDTYFKMNRKAEAKAQWERAARLGNAVAKKRLAKL